MIKLKPHFGIQAAGKITDYVRSTLVDLIGQYKVVIFRQQDISARDLERVTEMLGSVWYNSDDGILSDEKPYSLLGSEIITLVNNKGRGVLEDIWVPWHSDIAHRPWQLPGGTMPPRILYAHTISPNETSSTSYYDKTFVKADNIEIEYQSNYKVSWAPNRMPLVTVDPYTNQEIVNIQKLWVTDYNDSLDKLYQEVQAKENVIEHRWSPGDLIISNNHTTCHQRDKLVSIDERTLWRTTFQIPELIPLSIKPELI
jgi:alpha-ketoglutarate-dependent taurine dioxygenase